MFQYYYLRWCHNRVQRTEVSIKSESVSVCKEGSHIIQGGAKAQQLVEKYWQHGVRLARQLNFFHIHQLQPCLKQQKKNQGIQTETLSVILLLFIFQHQKWLKITKLEVWMIRNLTAGKIPKGQRYVCRRMFKKQRLNANLKPNKLKQTLASLSI